MVNGEREVSLRRKRCCGARLTADISKKTRHTNGSGDIKKSEPGEDSLGSDSFGYS